MDRIFSGIQPTGIIHLGNYIGAIKNWLKLQHEVPSIFSVVDLHATTIKYDASTRAKTIFNTASTLLACGLDPNTCDLFIQSDVKEHTELAWLIGTVTPYGDLTRMTQFKDKSTQHTDNINAGLFYYPVLMAADILIYKANMVPVGEDQLQHLEITREIARRFNAAYGDVFPEPKSLLTETPRIKGLDGVAKMSKSMDNYISLEESEDSLMKKLRGAKTDENRVKRTDPGNPDICNIFSLHNIFSSEDELKTINSECRSAGIGCVDCKKMLHKNLCGFMAPIQDKLNYYHQNPDEVKDILRKGASNAQKIANDTMNEVKDKMGFYRV